MTVGSIQFLTVIGLTSVFLLVVNWALLCVPGRHSQCLLCLSQAPLKRRPRLFKCNKRMALSTLQVFYNIIYLRSENPIIFIGPTQLRERCVYAPGDQIQNYLNQELANFLKKGQLDCRVVLFCLLVSFFLVGRHIFLQPLYVVAQKQPWIRQMNVAIF